MKQSFAIVYLWHLCRLSSGWWASIRDVAATDVCMVPPCISLLSLRIPELLTCFGPARGLVNSEFGSRETIPAKSSNSPISFHPEWDSWISWPLISMTFPILNRSIQFIFAIRRLPPISFLVVFATPSVFLYVCLYILASRFIRSISSMDVKLNLSYFNVSGDI